MRTIIALLLLAQPASAFTIYDTRAEWEAAAGSYYAEDFDGCDMPIPIEPGRESAIYLGPVRFTVPLPEDEWVGVHDGELHGSLLLEDRDIFDESTDRVWNSIFWQNWPITGIAFDFDGDADIWMHFMFGGGGGWDIIVEPGAFVGVLGLPGFHTIVMRMGEYVDEADFALDHLRYVTEAPMPQVPEPGTALLVALGLVAMARTRKRPAAEASGASR